MTSPMLPDQEIPGDQWLTEAFNLVKRWAHAASKTEKHAEPSEPLPQPWYAEQKAAWSALDAHLRLPVATSDPSAPSALSPPPVGPRDEGGEVVATSMSFNEAKAVIMGLPVHDVRALAVSQFIMLQLHDKYAASAGAAAPIEGKRLANELRGVIVDVEQGGGFDAVCLATIKRVAASLAAAPGSLQSSPTDANPKPDAAGCCNKTVAQRCDGCPHASTQGEAQTAAPGDRLLGADKNRGVHLSHCFQGEYENTCKYGFDDCPAQPSPAGATQGTEKYDDVLLPFLTLMRKELHANSGKGDRPGWLSMRADEALLEVYYHLAKLQKAVKNNDGPGIMEFSADVANMAMMVLDICGGLAFVEPARHAATELAAQGSGEREAFEAWFRAIYHGRLDRNMPDRSYNDPTAFHCWKAWNARALLAGASPEGRKDGAA